MTSRNGVEFAWELSQASIAQLPLSASAFQRRMASMLVHTIALGLVFTNALNAFSIPYLSATARELANTVILEAIAEPKTKTSLSLHCRSDKLFPLRLSGPSMTFIRSSSFNLDLSKPITIFQLSIWRAFAFGDQAKLSALVLPTTKADPNTDQIIPDFTALQAIITPWFGKNTMYNLPAYGQYLVSQSQVLTTLHSLWDFAKGLSLSAPHLSSPISFSVIYNWFTEKQLHSLKSHGLIPWLLVCDLAEFAGCAHPTISDLAVHLYSRMSKTGGQLSGPNGAVEAAYFWEEGGDSRKWTREELERNLEIVWEMVIDPKSPVERIRRYQDLAISVQGRELSVADLEHMLCKISRQMPKGVGRENKKRREGQSQKKKKRGKGDEDEDVLEEGDEKISVRKKTVKKAKKILV